VSTDVAPNVRHRLEYVAVASVMTVVGLVPHGLALWTGNVLGLAFYLLDAPHRRLAVRNLERAFPEWPKGDAQRTARRVFRHFGRLLIEVLRFTQLPKEEMRAQLDFEGADRVRAALANGKGVIFISGHFGFWEIQGIGHALQLPPMSVVARPLDNPLLHGLLERARTRLGNGVIYRRGGLRRIMRTLQANSIVAIMIDQHIQSTDAVTVSFFGRAVSTTSAVAQLALRTGAAVIPVFAVPIAGGRYKLIYDPPVPPPAPDCAEPLHDFTQRCTDVLERYVREHPDQWLWMHRRWRDPGPSEEDRGMFPAGAEDSEDTSELELRAEDDR
jgi:KDO2-lipid IV(A) lauroyltransferase